MPATSHGLFYPLGTATPDVPADMQTLAQSVDDRLLGASAALPASPVDGQVHHYVADAANGIIWQFKYRAAAAGSYKWEFIGGSPLHARVDAKVNSGVFGGYETGPAGSAHPSVTAPLAGDYLVKFGCWLGATTDSAVVSIRPGSGGSFTDANGAEQNVGSFSSVSREVRFNGNAPATQFQMGTHYTASSAVGSYWTGLRWLSVQPIRCSS